MAVFVLGENMVVHGKDVLKLRYSNLAHIG